MTNPTFAVVAALGCVAITGCQANPPTSPTAAVGDAASHGGAGLADIPACADDAVATLDGGVQVTFQGSDPNDEDRCLVQWLGRPHQLYFGFWTDDHSTPMSDEARAALRTALSGPIGTEASFDTEHAEMWKRVTVTHIANGSTMVAGAPRPALELKVVRHDAEGRPDVRAETHFWIDRATGVLLRRESVTPMADGEVAKTTSWQLGSLQQAG